MFLFHRAAAQLTAVMEGGDGGVVFYIKFVTFVVGY